jgi:hypothetical protein
VLVLCACAAAPLRPVRVVDLPGHRKTALDTSPDEHRRLVPPEAYIRTYLMLFGGLAPLEVQAKAKGKNLFDTWDDYLSALGLPDYKTDTPRATQTNALMIATFERLGNALCEQAAIHDLNPRRNEAPIVFTFNLTPKDPTDDELATRFDRLHRLFLGYPAALAPPERLARFAALYRGVVEAHRKPGAPKSLLSPVQAGWAAVCEGLVDHPELHFY